MQQEPQQRFTTTELALAEKIGTFLLPMMRQVAENVAKPRTDATTNPSFSI